MMLDSPLGVTYATSSMPSSKFNQFLLFGQIVAACTVDMNGRMGLIWNFGLVSGNSS